MTRHLKCVTCLATPSIVPRLRKVNGIAHTRRAQPCAGRGASGRRHRRRADTTLNTTALRALLSSYPMREISTCWGSRDQLARYRCARLIDVQSTPGRSSGVMSIRNVGSATPVHAPRNERSRTNARLQAKRAFTPSRNERSHARETGVHDGANGCSRWREIRTIARRCPARGPPHSEASWDKWGRLPPGSTPLSSGSTPQTHSSTRCSGSPSTK